MPDLTASVSDSAGRILKALFAAETVSRQDLLAALPDISELNLDKHLANLRAKGFAKPEARGIWRTCTRRNLARYSKKQARDLEDHYIAMSRPKPARKPCSVKGRKVATRAELAERRARLLDEITGVSKCRSEILAGLPDMTTNQFISDIKHLVESGAVQAVGKWSHRRYFRQAEQ